MPFKFTGTLQELDILLDADNLTSGLRGTLAAKSRYFHRIFTLQQRQSYKRTVGGYWLALEVL